jgi:hypothetical protein
MEKERRREGTAGGIRQQADLAGRIHDRDRVS